MKSSKGFTIVELLGVIVVLGVIASIGVASFNNISSNVRKKNLENIISKIEINAKSFAENNDLEGTTQFAVAKLISNGYLQADEYNDEDYPVIKNPVDKTENLACRIVEVTLDDTEYTVKVLDSEYSNCTLSISEIYDNKIQVRAFKFNNDTLGTELNIENNEVQWTNTPVLIQVSSDSLNIESISFSDTINTYENNNNKLYMTSDNLDDYTKYSNLYKADAVLFVKQEINISVKISIEKDNEISDVYVNKKIIVKIDKEPPTVSVSDPSNMENFNKSLIILGSDGNGSGVKNAYLQKSGSTSKTSYTFDSNGKATINKLTNGTYTLWIYDNVGNKSEETTFVINNIDTTEPTVSAVYTYTPTTNRGTYDQSGTLTITADDKESGIASLKYCSTNSSSSCTPNEVQTYSNSNYSVSHQITIGNGANGTTVCYYAIDKENNKSSTSCSGPYKVDGTIPIINNSITVSNNTISFSAYDNESGVKSATCTLSNGKTVTATKTSSSSNNYTCTFSNLSMNTTYSYTIKAVNNSNLESNTKTGSFKTSFTIGDIINDCSGYCSSGKYIQYGSKTFVLYKNTSTAALGISKTSITGQMIDYCSCTHIACSTTNGHRTKIADGKPKTYDTADMCSTTNLLSDSYSGILSYGKDFYNTLPSNRYYVTVSYPFKIEYISQNDLTLTARYGLLTYSDYNTLKSKTNLSWLATTSGWLATLKKDGSTYSSTVGSVGAYLLSNGSYVTRQMYQEYNMNFVIAFNNSVPITEGSGTSSSPYIIDTNWTG